jgi:hypothetical protein
MQVFIEAQAGSPDKHDYNEQTLEFKGIRTAVDFIRRFEMHT